MGETDDTQANKLTGSVLVVMGFWRDGGGSELTAKKEFLKTSSVQTGDVIKARGQDPWAERTVLYV